MSTSFSNKAVMMWGGWGRSQVQVSETYILSYVKYTASGNLPYDTRNTNLVFVTTEGCGTGWEAGGRLKRAGTYSHSRLIPVDVLHKPTQYCTYPPA